MSDQVKLFPLLLDLDVRVPDRVFQPSYNPEYRYEDKVWPSLSLGHLVRPQCA